MAAENLHVVLVPWLQQGHIIPTLDFARLLAERGTLVTLVTTSLNLSRIQAFVGRVKESSLPISFLQLRFPCEEVGLPDGLENVDLLPFDDESLEKFSRATSLMREPLQLHLLRSSPRPSCIVSDFCNPWTRHIARELRIPLFLFYSIPCFSQLCEHNLMHHRAYDGVAGGDAPVVVPDLPVRVEVTMAQAPGFFPLPDWKWMGEEVAEAELCSNGVVVNTFSSLEPAYIKLYEKAKGKKVWPVGPVSLCNKLASDLAFRGDTAYIHQEQCLSWLDSKEPHSVLYVSFGTLVRYPLSQLVEIGLGLEAAKLPVIWVIKAGEQQSAVEDWLAQGFEERTKDRILVCRGWAPQVLILSHAAVGGFLTHCGWNSLFEGIAAGIPVLTFPGFFDQFLNERFLVDVLKVGVPSGMKKPFWDETIVSGDGQVTREEVKRAVEKLMGQSVEAHEMRRRAAELGKMARSAMEVGGSSEQSLGQFICEVRLLAEKQTICAADKLDTACTTKIVAVVAIMAKAEAGTSMAAVAVEDLTATPEAMKATLVTGGSKMLGYTSPCGYLFFCWIF